MKKCSNCGTPNNDDNIFCTECGKPILQGCVCPHCGNPVNDGDLFCQNCGKKISEVPSTSYVEYPQQESPYEVSRDKIHKGMYILSFLFPIVGIIYAITIWTKKPSTARSAIYASILGIIVTIVGTFALKSLPTFTSSNSEMSAYENAMISSEPAVLQNYLDMYIKAPVTHRDSIKMRLQVLMKIDRDWDNARISQSKSALQLFIDRNPDNVHVREARLIIDSLDFVTAKTGNSMESYKKYMEEHEQGYYYDEARSAYDRLEEEMIRAAQLKAEQDSLKAEQEEKSQEELAKTNTAIGAFDVKDNDSE